MRSRHLGTKAASPTARTSSISSTSGLTLMATEKPRRMYMPEEYVLTGASMKFSSSAKRTISSNFRLISFLDRPSMMPLIKTFSRPLISGWNPAPSSMRAEIFPSTLSRPEVGLAIPATSLSSVLLPEPFSPMTPNVIPFSTWRLMPSTAMTSSSAFKERNRSPLTSALLNVWKRCRAEYFWYTRVTFSSSMANIRLPPGTNRGDGQRPHIRHKRARAKRRA